MGARARVRNAKRVRARARSRAHGSVMGAHHVHVKRAHAHKLMYVQ